MESSSLKLLKQSGLTDAPTEKIRNQPQRYPSQFDESSVRTDITEADIATYVKRIADKVNEKAADYNFCQNKLCDQQETIEDCPQNACYKDYLDPNRMDKQKIDPSKKVFFDSLKDLITSKPIAYQEDINSDAVAKTRIDELLQNRQPRCDYNNLEKPKVEDMKPTNGICSMVNPNACDKVLPNEDCGNRECYKKYLMNDILPPKKQEENKPASSTMRVKFNDMESFIAVESHPIGIRTSSTAAVASENKLNNDYQKKYNTLVVNSDIMVPEFIDVLVVISEKPIKITLPQLQGPTLASSVGTVTSASNLLIKNLSLCAHQIVTKGSNKIDTVRTSVSIEPAGKKTLGAIHDSWILL